MNISCDDPEDGSLEAIEKKASHLLAVSPTEDFDPRIYGALEMIEGLAQHLKMLRDDLDKQREDWKPLFPKSET